MTPAPHPSVTRPSHNPQLLGQSGPWPERQLPATSPMQTSAKDKTTPSSQDRSRLSGSQQDPQRIRVIAVANKLGTSLNGILAQGSPIEMLALSPIPEGCQKPEMPEAVEVTSPRQTKARSSSRGLGFREAQGSLCSAKHRQASSSRSQRNKFRFAVRWSLQACLPGHAHVAVDSKASQRAKLRVEPARFLNPRPHHSRRSLQRLRQIRGSRKLQEIRAGSPFRPVDAWKATWIWYHVDSEISSSKSQEFG